MTRRRI